MYVRKTLGVFQVRQVLAGLEPDDFRAQEE